MLKGVELEAAQDTQNLIVAHHVTDFRKELLEESVLGCGNIHHGRCQKNTAGEGGREEGREEGDEGEELSYKTTRGREDIVRTEEASTEEMVEVEP